MPGGQGQFRAIKDECIRDLRPAQDHAIAREVDVAGMKEAAYSLIDLRDKELQAAELI